MAVTVGHGQILIDPELNNRMLAKTQAAASAYSKQLERTLRPQITPGVNALAYRKNLQAATAKAGEQKIKASLDAVQYRMNLRKVTAKAAQQEIKLDLDKRLYDQKLRAATAAAATQEAKLELTNVALYKARLAAATRPVKQTVNMDMDRGLSGFLSMTGLSLQHIRGRIQILRSAFVSLRPVMLMSAATLGFFLQYAMQLIPTLAQAGAGLAAAVPLFGALAQGAGVAAVSLMGVMDVFEKLGALQDKPGLSSRSLLSNTKQLATATRGIETAERSLANAQRDSIEATAAVGRARLQARSDLQQLQQSLAGARLEEEGAALALERAERAYSELTATRQVSVGAISEVQNKIRGARLDEEAAVLTMARAEQAYRDITRERKLATEQLNDLRLSLRGAKLDEEGAALAVERARQRLREVGGDGDTAALGLAKQRAIERLAKAETSRIKAQEKVNKLERSIAVARSRGLSEAAMAGMVGDHRSAVSALAASKQSERTATLALTAAEANLSKTTSKGSLEVREADLAYRQSLQSLREAKERTKDLKGEQVELTRSSGENTLRWQEADLARRQASQGYNDVSFRIRDLTQEEARLRDVQGASSLEIREADLARRQANQGLVDARTRTRELAAQLADAQRKGIEGSNVVQDALQAQRDAQENVILSQQALADAHENLAMVQEQGALASSSIETAQHNLNRAMEKAGPAASKFAQFLFDEVLPALDIWKRKIQDVALPKFQTAIENLLPLVERLGPSFVRTGDIIGDIAIKFSEFLASGQRQQDLVTIADSHNRILEKLGDAGISASSILMDLYIAVLPQAERFADWVKKGLDRLADLTSEARDSGALKDFFEKAGDAAAQWGRIIWNIIVTIYNIFSAIKPLSDETTDNLEDMTKRWKEWTSSDEGQGKIKKFFEFLRDLPWDNIFKGMAAVAGAMAAINATRSIFALLTVAFSPAGVIALGAAGLVASFGLLYTRNEDFRESVNETAKNIADKVGPALEDFVKSLDDVYKELQPLIEIGLDFIEDFLIQFAEYLPEIAEHLTPMAEAFSDLAIAYQNFSDAWEEQTGQSFAEFLANITASSIITGMAALTTGVNQLARFIEAVRLAMQGDWWEAIEVLFGVREIEDRAPTTRSEDLPRITPAPHRRSEGADPRREFKHEPKPAPKYYYLEQAEQLRTTFQSPEPSFWDKVGTQWAFSWRNALLGGLLSDKSVLRQELSVYFGGLFEHIDLGNLLSAVSPPLILADLIDIDEITTGLDETFGFGGGIHGMWEASWGEDGWARGIWNGFSGSFTTSLDAFTTSVEGVWSGSLSTIRGAWSSAWGEDGWARNIWNRFTSALTTSLSTLTSSLETIWSGSLSTVRTTWNSAWGEGGWARNIWNGFTDFFGSALDTWTTTTISNWEGFQSTIRTTWNAAWGEGGWARNIWEGFTGFFGDTFSTWKETTSRNWETFTTQLEETWSGAWDTISGAFTTAKDSLLGIGEDLVNGLADRLETGIKIGKGFAEGFIGFFSKIPEKIRGALEEALDVLRDLAGKIKEAIPGIGTLVDKVVGMANLANPTVINSVVTGISTILPRWGLAEGGYVRGPGTTTSDSIVTRLSDQEYVQPAEAVHKYGVGFMDAVRAGTLPMPAFAKGGLVGKDIKLGGLPMPPGPGSVRGDTGVWRGIVDLIKKWGNPDGGTFSNAYRPGDPLWHGSGLAVDWAGYNQDKLAGMFLAIAPDVLELIHRTPKGDYGVSRGRAGSMDSGTLSEHLDHIHIAMTKEAVERHLGQAIPDAVSAMEGGGGFLMKTWRSLAEGVWDGLKGTFDKALAPLNNVPFGPAVAKMVTSVPEKLFSFLDKEDPGSDSGASAGGMTVGRGKAPKGALPAYFSWFGDDPSIPGAVDNSDTGITADGSTTAQALFSTTYWPLGTKATMYANGKSISLVQKDLGPAQWANAQYPPGNVIVDLTPKAAMALWGSLKNGPGYVKVDKFGTGRTLFPFRERGYDDGGWLEQGTTIAHHQPSDPDAVLTRPQWAAMYSLAGAGAKAITGDTHNHYHIDNLNVDADEVLTAKKFEEWMSNVAVAKHQGVRKGPK